MARPKKDEAPAAAAQAPDSLLVKTTELLFMRDNVSNPFLLWAIQQRATPHRYQNKPTTHTASSRVFDAFDLVKLQHHACHIPA